jgi:C1A family cysteine protease
LKVVRLYPNIDNIRQALHNGYAVAFAIRIDVIINEWFTNHTHQARSGYIVPMPSPFNRVATHAMHIISSDDKTRLFKVQNSMGDKFGDGGFCYVTYSALLDHSFTGLAFFILG